MKASPVPLARIARWAWRIVASLVLLELALIAFAYWQATRDPEVRRASVAVAGWPTGAPPVSILLISDTHVAGPDMPPERLARIMERLNALRPDLVLLAGDYISEKSTATRVYTADQAVAPFTRLRPPLGVVAVLGNHDHWADQPGFQAAFARHGISLLHNAAIRRGPFVIGGVDDAYSHHDDVPATLRAMAALGPGPRLILTHSIQIERQLPRSITALLAGHSHCGQIVLPEVGFSIGPLYPASWAPRGEKRVAGTPRFITAGLGTSVVPLRLGAPPDVWLIRFGPVRTPTRLAVAVAAH